MLNMIKTKLSEHFEFVKRKTNLKTEILAGLSTFLALSYIFIVNPAILSEGGMNKSMVLFATIVASGVSTLLMGIFANAPLVLAPGLEINAYVAYYVIGQLGFAWQQALGAVFWSGAIFIILTLSGVREKIIKAIPDRMKTGLSLCVGVFIALIALKIAGVLLYEGIKVQGLGLLVSKPAFVLYFGLITVLVLQRFRTIGAVLISIILSAILANYIGLGNTTNASTIVSSDMFSGLFKADLSVILNPKMLNVILVLFLVDFYGNVAKFIGLTRNTTIVNNDGTIPKMKQALTVDSIGVMLGSLLGTTSVITYVESAVGIGEGGRTGVTAIVCAVLMLSFLVLSPIVGFVPVIATTGALLWVGIKLLPSRIELKTYNKLEVAIVLMMVLTVIYTFAIDKALLVGFIAYIGGLVFTGKAREVDKYTVLSTLLLLVGVALQVL